MREDEAAVLQPVAADEPGDDRGDQGAERHEDPDDGVQVLGDPGAAGVLGLLVEQGVPGVGGDARADAGQGEDQQDGGDVRDESGGQQGDAGERDGQGEQPAPGQRGQQRGRGTDADADTAREAQHQQAVEHRAAAQVGGVQHAHRDGGGDGPGHGGAGDDQQQHGTRAALVDGGAGTRAAQALQGERGRGCACRAASGRSARTPRRRTGRPRHRPRGPRGAGRTMRRRCPAGC